MCLKWFNLSSKPFLQVSPDRRENCLLSTPESPLQVLDVALWLARTVLNVTLWLARTLLNVTLWLAGTGLVIGRQLFRNLERDRVISWDNLVWSFVIGSQLFRSLWTGSNDWLVPSCVELCDWQKQCSYYQALNMT